ncbi:hypothetical protein QUB67_07595 [Microcoleus sp. ARI1-A1]|uniref:hypothetical protein n=1 Tax=unclassified Microcoleus TaxID=2642155 RepID=UPI002FCE7FB2
MGKRGDLGRGRSQLSRCVARNRVSATNLGRSREISKETRFHQIIVHQDFVGGEKPGFCDKSRLSTRNIGRNPVSPD